jgi:microcystin-dependent protein
MRKAIPKIQTDNPDLNRVQDQILAALNPLLREALAEPAGVMKPFGGGEAPDGYLLCDGATVSRARYAALFMAIGVAYGAGDGVSTFTLPDGRGRTFIGAGQGSGLTLRARGDTGGAETHVLTAAEMPEHTHPLSYGENPITIGANGNNSVGGGSSWTSGATGGGGAHNNMPPYFVGNWIIKT